MGREVKYNNRFIFPGFSLVCH